MNPLIRETTKRMKALERQMLNEAQFMKEKVCEFDSITMSYAIQIIHDLGVKYERKLNQDKR